MRVFLLVLGAALVSQAQDNKPPEQSLTFTVGASTIGPLVFSSGEEIARCDANEPNGKPKNCHLIGKHTLDDVIGVFWQEQQDRRAMYQERAEELKKKLSKP